MGLANIDLLAKPRGFMINGNNTAKTKHGGLLSITMVGLIIAIVVGQLIKFLTSDSPIIIESTKGTRLYPNTTLHERRLLPIVKVTRGLTPIKAEEVLKYMTPVILRTKNVYVENEEGVLVRHAKTWPYFYKSCKELVSNPDYDYAQAFEKDEIDMTLLDYSLCAEYNITDSFVLGNKKDEVNSTTQQFIIKPCSLPTGCGPMSEMNQFEVQLMSQRVDRQYGNNTEPVTLSYEDTYVTGLEPGTMKFNLAFLQLIDIWDIKGVPFHDKIRDSIPVVKNFISYDSGWVNETEVTSCPAFDFDDIEAIIGFFDCQPYYILEFTLGDTVQRVNRNYLSIPESLSQLGGLVTLAQAVMLFIYMIFHGLAFKHMLVKKIFRFLPPQIFGKKESRWTKLYFWRYCSKKSRDNAATTSSAERSPEATRVVKNNVEYIQVSSTIFDAAYSQIEQHMDMVTIVKELFHLKVLLSTLMSNYNRKVSPIVILSHFLKEKRKEEAANNLQLLRNKRKIDANTKNKTNNTEQDDCMIRDGNTYITELDNASSRREENRDSSHLGFESLPDDKITLNDAFSKIAANVKHEQADRGSNDPSKHNQPSHATEISELIDRYCYDSLLYLREELNVQETRISKRSNIPLKKDIMPDTDEGLCGSPFMRLSDISNIATPKNHLECT